MNIHNLNLGTKTVFFVALLVVAFAFIAEVNPFALRDTGASRLLDDGVQADVRQEAAVAAPASVAGAAYERLVLTDPLHNAHTRNKVTRRARELHRVVYAQASAGDTGFQSGPLPSASPPNPSLADGPSTLTKPPDAPAGHEKLDDTRIESQVADLLDQDDRFSGCDITVSAHAGVVLISGNARRATQIDQAETVAAKAQGVRQVINRLAVR